jgi:hypothetical protein
MQPASTPFSPDVSATIGSSGWLGRRSECSVASGRRRPFGQPQQKPYAEWQGAKPAQQQRCQGMKIQIAAQHKCAPAINRNAAEHQRLHHGQRIKPRQRQDRHAKG